MSACSLWLALTLLAAEEPSPAKAADSKATPSSSSKVIEKLQA